MMHIVETILILLPSVAAFLTVLSTKNKFLPVMQAVTIVGLILALVFDLLFFNSSHLLWIIIGCAIAEVLHLILLGTGKKIPVLLHELIVCFAGLFPWYHSMIFTIIGICVIVIIVVAIMLLKEQMILPLVHETRKDK